MNISLKQFSELIDKESKSLETPHGHARLLEFKIISPDARYHGYVQMLLLIHVGTPKALWRKFKGTASLSRGDTLWECTEEYRRGLVPSSLDMIKERIADLAFKAEADEDTIKISFESAKTIPVEGVAQTRDSKHSFIVTIPGQKKRHRHV